MEIAIIVAVVVVALVFDYTNGFHDAANAIATSVSTRALTPRVALLMAAINAPCVGIWAAFGVGLRRFLTEPSRLRVFNVTMAGLLVLSLYPIFLN